MADATKYELIGVGNNNNHHLVTDLKNIFSILKARKTVTFAYVFTLVFVSVTVFLAFSPSPNASSPWFTNIFSSSTTTATTPDSYKSQLSPFFSFLFPNTTNSSRSTNATSQSPNPNPNEETFKAPSLENITQSLVNSSQDAVPVSIPSTNQTTISTIKNSSLQGDSTSLVNKEVGFKNQTLKPDEAKSVKKNQTTNATVPAATNVSSSNASSSSSSSSAVKGVVSNNYTASLAKKQNNEKNGAREKDEYLESLIKCDFFDGEWVKDDSYPLYESGSCTDLIDEQFNCIRNGRLDKNYQKYKWKPKGCTLPRLDGHRLLDLLRGKRLVFVGDSLNRNMWESLICILRNAAKHKSRVYEVNGRVHFRGEASYSFIFKDYKFTVELFVSPFLVQEWEMPDKNGTKKETLRLDLVGRSSDQYKDADIIVFNTGHWWTHDKTAKGEDYYQEGSHIYHELNVLEAFRKAITTWSRWVDANVNPSKSMVFFRGYSASHFSGGQWNSGGACDSETEPINNEKYLNQYPPKMRVLENVLKFMKTNVTYLNITRMTDFRKDGHPSIYRKLNLSPEERKSPLRYQDCSHWCLPGVPDAWNEILYAEILTRQYQNQHQQKRG
ncbi:hypothetical protein TanjilG_06919 [Lupinus angustifolius]|uniref:Uncharacterized protein n=1 Tax=Lupinus angustifolius TaxID=3871 RepID=A0A4P1QV98_LUPAN|nr:PREDICTED: protein trichome birefringence [Lupinus angustifolius]OIV95457.1 hypothetical protein TanjilG_06919 [Lupinus angustifolius]